MSSLPRDPRLAEYAEHIARLEWSALILDAELSLVWVSDPLKEFVGSSDETDLGYGLHIANVFVKDIWLSGIHPESRLELFSGFAPFVLTDFKERGLDPADVFPEPFVELLHGVAPAEIPFVWSTSFQYVDPTDPDLPPYPVKIFFVRVNREDGAVVGWLASFNLGIRPNLLALLARGDEQMYERMAKLVEPRPRRAAILFCDLEGSGLLSKRLPSASYFRLVRQLWTGIDSAVASATGIVGKHAGDGASAYFLVDDLGTDSKAADAAIRAARKIHELSGEVFRDVLDSDCLMKVGVHWGGSLYMGQLIPGGRLDVTALGDEVNEAARIQEAAGSGQTLVSKNLLEQLESADASALGIDVEKLLYRPLSELAPESEKVVRDAGAIPVVDI